MLLKPPDRSGRMLARWQSASTAGGWPPGQLWWTPAARAVVDALGGPPTGVTGPSVDATAAVERLGGERAAAGISLASALTDLAAGLDVLRSGRRVRPADARALADALSVGWAEAMSGWLGHSDHGCVDTLTRLASRDYLITRLREIFAEALRWPVAARDRRALVVVAVRPGSAPLITEQRMVGVGHVLETVFTQGETLARVAPNVAVAIAYRDETLNDQLVALQLELSWTALSAAPAHARIWLESLPTHFELVAPLIDDVCSC